MRAKTADNRKLKRLAKEYADAWEQLKHLEHVWGSERDMIACGREYYRKARKKLHDAIDSLTILTLGPSAVETYP